MGIGLPWSVNLGKFENLKEFTILLKSEGNTSKSGINTSYGSLDLTQCTIEFPGISKPLKFKGDHRMLKVL
jgi:hypothetical protein